MGSIREIAFEEFYLTAVAELVDQTGSGGILSLTVAKSIHTRDDDPWMEPVNQFLAEHCHIQTSEPYMRGCSMMMGGYRVDSEYLVFTASCPAGDFLDHACASKYGTTQLEVCA